MTYVLVFSWLFIWVVGVTVGSVYKTTRELTPIKYVYRPLWDLAPVVQKYTRYDPIKLNASVMVTDMAMLNTYDHKEVLHYATEEVMYKLLRHAKAYVTIESHRNPLMYGTEIRASIGVYKEI